MRFARSLGAWMRRHPDLAEPGIGMAAALAVLALALVQWGLTDEGWLRGTTLGLALGVVVVGAYRRARRVEERRLGAIADQRSRLARELHDAVASQVSIIGIQAAAGRRVLRDRPADTALALERIELAARAANSDLRRMLEALRDPVAADADDDAATSTHAIAAPTLRDLPALVRQFRAAGLGIRLSRTENVAGVPAAVDEAAYRIVQEALANTLVHAGPVPTEIDVHTSDGALSITVANRLGRPQQPHRGSGLGLRGMRERTAQFGGTLTAAPTTDGRFVVEATLPLQARDR